MSRYLAASIGIVFLFTSMPGFAHEAGEFFVRVGAVNVDPNEEVSELRLNGTPLPGTGATVGDNTQVMLTATWMVREKFGLELLAATPFKHDVTTTGLSGLGLPEGEFEIKHLPPTLSLLWYPLAADSVFQPFIGAGVNWTIFFDESVSDATAAALGASDLSLSNSLGLAFRVGFDVHLGENVSLNAGAWYLDIDSDLSLNTALGEVTADVSVDPWVIGAGLGYHF